MIAVRAERENEHIYHVMYYSIKKNVNNFIVLNRVKNI